MCDLEGREKSPIIVLDSAATAKEGDERPARNSYLQTMLINGGGEVDRNCVKE